MVAEGEDWRSVEVPLSSDAASLAPSSLPSAPGPKPGTGSNDTTELFDLKRFFYHFTLPCKHVVMSHFGI
jgi:hypothetical protein